jgi:carbamoyltransferase
MIEINRNPSRRDLLVFTAALPILFGLIGALRWHAGSPGAAKIVWVAGAALTMFLLTVPRARRWMYVGWMFAVFPIAWVISHVMLAAAYFLVATPIAIAMRALGSDPMRRTFDRSAESYWIVRDAKRDDSRYFRQF